MSATMAKKRTHSRHKNPRESFHLPTDLRKALGVYLDSLKPRPGKSGVMRTALEEFLERRGFWPSRKE